MVNLLNKSESSSFFDVEKIKNFYFLYDFLFDLPQNKFVKEETVEINRILSHILTDVDSIQYRHDIALDFLNHSDVLSNIRMTLFDLPKEQNEYIKMKSMAQKNIRESYNAPSSIAKSIRYKAAYCKQLMLYFDVLYEKLKNICFSSSALRELNEELNDFIANDKMVLVDLCNYLEFNNSDTFSGQVLIRFDEFFRISYMDIMPYFETVCEDRTIKMFGRLKPNRLRLENDRPSVKDDIFAAHLGKRMDEILSAVSKKLFDYLNNIRISVNCYLLLQNFVAFLESSGVPWTFPEFNGRIRIDKLYDVALLRIKDREDLIANDYDYGERVSGIVVLGKNGSGKTVYLRSLYNAYLLAQIGFPLPAAKAELVASNGLFCVGAYVKRENTEDKMNIGGFEHEVIRIKQVIDESKKGSIVFLNEVFQSTAFNDASKALTDILDFFSKIGVKWICVSHLPNLFAYAENLPSVFLKHMTHIFNKTCLDQLEGNNDAD